MKNEITIPVLKEEDMVAALKRSERYSLKRDIQAMEYNEAIATRLAREQEIQKSENSEE